MNRRAHFITFICVLLACTAAVFWMVGPYFLALYLGGSMAMLAYPADHWLRGKGFGPRQAAASVTALLLLVVIAPLTAFAVMAVKQGIAISGEMAEVREFSPKKISETLGRSRTLRPVFGAPSEINSRLKSAVKASGGIGRAWVLKLGKGLPEFLLQMALALIAFYFFLVDGERFMNWLLGLGALDGRVQRELIKSFRRTTISTIVAGLAASASQAVLISLGYLMLDIPGAFLAGGVTFILAWVPMIGTAPATAAGALYLFTQGASGKVWLMIALGIATALVDNVIRPMVLKGRADMHPLVGFVAIIGGIRMFGMLGVFIGPILAAMLISLLGIRQNARIDAGR